MLNLALIIGLWTTNCIMTQNGRNSGFVVDSYDVRENGSYDHKTEWYSDAACSQQYATDSESGVVKVGKKLSGIFVSGNTFEANFENVIGIDLGAIRVEENKLKIARGMKESSIRNTMVGIFDYLKK